MEVTNHSESPQARVTVELFGSARLATGRRTVTVTLPNRALRSEVACALAHECPDLRGVAVTEDGSDLAPSYTFNLNGHSFVSNEPVSLADGDTLLLFSSLAGG